MNKLQMKLSSECVTLFRIYDEDILGHPHVTSKSTLLEIAIRSLPINEIDWKKVHDYNLHVSQMVKGEQATFTLNNELVLVIEQLRQQVMSDFHTKRVYRPFIITLILKAAIITAQHDFAAIQKNNHQQDIIFMQQNVD